MVVLVTLAIVMLGVQFNEAVKCYSCTSGFSVGTDCRNSSAEKDMMQCNATCKASMTIGGSVNRGCGDGGTKNGCESLGAAYYCEYNCNTDLCNNQPPPASASHTAPTLAAVLTLAICAIGFRAAA